MSNKYGPVAKFEKWLPGELVYSARKAGYDKKIERAQLPINDPRSIYGFLGGEWFTFGQMRNEGNHHKPYHGKTAQLQLAKFAAGLFDKRAVGLWLVSGGDATEANFVAAAEQTADEIISEQPWDMPTPFNNPEEDLAKRFEYTTFSLPLQTIMERIDSLARGVGDYQEDSSLLRNLSTRLGGYAVNCYELYAKQNLTPDQFVLPESHLTR